MRSTGSAAGWQVRRAAPADAEAMAALHLAVWDDAYAGLVPAEVLAARRRDRESRVTAWQRLLAPRDPAPPPTYVAETTGTDRGLIGFATAGPARGEDPPADREVWALYARAAWWGTPVGWHLLRTSLGDDPAFLWVLEGNERAIRFYRRQGFEADGTTVTADHGVELRMVRR